MNMLPTLIDIVQYDKILINDIVDYAERFNCFSDINQVLYPFIHKHNRHIQTSAFLSRQLRALSNAVFNYVVCKLRELTVMNQASIQSSFRNWSRVRDEHKVRFVWLLVDDSEIILLNKSDRTYANISDCLTSAWKLQPSIDYVDNRVFEILTYEIVTAHEQCDELDNDRIFYANDLKLINHITSKGIRYNFSATGNCVTIQMPWRIPRRDHHLYIYYTKKSDNWFYCSNPNISEAYHESHHL